MPLVTFYFQLHQPFRLHPDVEKFLWEDQNRQIFKKLAEKNYLPATRMFTELIRWNGSFKIALSMSGTFLEQASLYQPEVIRALQELLDAGRQNRQVEYLEETYYHSLVSLFSDPNKKEFKDQVSLHRQKMKELFGIKPQSFRNTDLVYNNDLANVVADMGFKAILCERRDDMFTPQNGKPRSPNAIFRAMGRKGRTRDLILIARNRNLSEDMAYRFRHGNIAPGEYAEHIARIDGEAVLLGCDYEQIGEHLWAGTETLGFWKGLAGSLSDHPGIIMANPTEIAERFRKVPCPVLDIRALSSSLGGDTERGTFGWLGTPTQYALLKDIEALEEEARQAGGAFLNKWRHLTTSDHLCYLREGERPDHVVHEYFSPYETVAAATYLLTRNIDSLETAIKSFNVRKKVQQTPVIIIAPETARLPTQGMGKFAQYVLGKSGGLGDVISALCKGLVERKIPVHFITLNLRRRYREEANMTDEEWIKSRHRLDPEFIHLVSSSLYENHRTAYDGDPTITAAEFQRQIINTYLKDIRSKYEGRALVHTHDWMAGGAIVAYAKSRGIPVLHTVHNTHTDLIPLEKLQGINLERIWDNLFLARENDQDCIDALATAIRSSTLVSYVGQTFLKEIVQDYFLDRPIIPGSVRQETKAKYHHDLALVIPNGISPSVYPENQKEDPAPDKPGLARRFGPDDDIIEAKRASLVKFQSQTGLAIDPHAILLYWPSRLDPFQKGIELLEDIALRFVVEHPDVQIAVVGDPVGNDPIHAEIMGRIACASEGKIAYYRFNEDLSILGYAAASDVFGASLYEPFGQIDVVGNLYGATATNRDTGGYRDKIVSLSLRAWGAPQDLGNGVLFTNYDSTGLWWGLRKTVENHRYFRKNPHHWQRQAKRIMKEARKNWSLDSMVAGYIMAYERLNDNKPLV